MTDDRLRLARRFILVGFLTVLVGQAIYPFEAGEFSFSFPLLAISRCVAPVASALLAWAWWSWLGSVVVRFSGMSRRLLSIFALAYTVLAASDIALAVQGVMWNELYISFWLTFVGSSLTAVGFWKAARVFPSRPSPSQPVTAQGSAYGHSKTY